MGCCEAKSSEKSPSVFQDHLKACIKYGNPKQLSYHLLSYSKSSKQQYDINSSFATEEFGEINLLGFALALGKLAMFQYVHKSLNADLQVMENLFALQGLNALSIICGNNYIELFNYYAPLYTLMQKSFNKNKRKLKETIEFSSQYDKIIECIDSFRDSSYTSVQRACFNGHISMVGCIVEFCKKTENVPVELDIHYVEELHGHNCALIACKTGNYSMIKYLHSNCSADFSVFNNNKENALQILAASARVSHLSEFLQCFIYIVEKIELDYTYNYQETLLLLEYEKAINYFTAKLAEKGIHVRKQDLETQERGKFQENGKKCLEMDQKSFCLTRMYPELAAQEISVVDSVSSHETSFPSIVF